MKKRIMVTGGAGFTPWNDRNFFIMDFYYVYILESKTDGNWYTGYTKKLRSRFEQHNAGKVTSTKHRTPFQLIYFEGCINQSDALRREKYLKTHYGKMFVKKRLKSYFTGQEEQNHN